MQHNRRGGRDSIGITPVPEILIYLGNNRDTAGTAAPSNASRTTSDDYLAYLRKDIRLDPRRFVDLQLFKTALFLSDHEPGNNLNYRLNGSQPSQALAWNPLNFPISPGRISIRNLATHPQEKSGPWRFCCCSQA